jgi:hypothetical protein
MLNELLEFCVVAEQVFPDLFGAFVDVSLVDAFTLVADEYNQKFQPGIGLLGGIYLSFSWIAAGALLAVNFSNKLIFF